MFEIQIEAICAVRAQTGGVGILVAFIKIGELRYATFRSND